jgi:site-specific recombinase XerD
MLVRYLVWLHSNGHLSFDPEPLRLYPRRLPPIAQEFLDSLEPTRKASSCKNYQTSLRGFHAWLDCHDVALTKLRRRHIAPWFKSLSDRGLHPVTRVAYLQCVRTYLRWLREYGEIVADPDDLVRRSDMPKLPTYLPRPLPPETDLKLQEQLSAATCIYRQGLLLMRNTGLRIGELMGLERDCVRLDHVGNRFLKVPLGKLNNERLVPLDDSTHRLVQRLRRSGPRVRSWLLATPSGVKTRYERFRTTLHDVCAGLESNGPVTTHRLRHTYATSLLNAGMSLLGIMRLLGHRDFRMTLRYTLIVQETVGREYFAALATVESRYHLAAKAAQLETNPAKMASDLVRWLKNHHPGDRTAQTLTKRLQRIQDALQRLLSTPKR